MNVFKVVGDFFALDIGSGAIRAVQLKPSGSGWLLQMVGSVSISMKVAMSDAPEDQKKLSEAITTLVGQTGIRTKNVVLGIPSAKMFATVVDVPAMSKEELASTIKYQAEQYVPMSLDESKIDWDVLGKSPNDPSKNEVLLVTVANSFTESRLDLLEELGFNVIAIEPDSLALARALVASGSSTVQILVNVSDSSTDIVLVYGDTPRLIRSVPTGLQSLTKAAVQNLNIQDEQALQFIFKFGVLADRLEGQVLRALDSTIDQLTSEIVKSIKFFETRYPATPIDGVSLTGYGATIPGFTEYVASKTTLPTTTANPWSQIAMSNADKQRLADTAGTYTIAIGLAMRKEGL
ncbi:MAG: type IV pilus assembly protein PilM [Candidatus Saccharimonadales bacterium]